MKHFDIEEWVDFARGVAADEKGSEMQGHLARGCRGCQQLVDFCAKVSSIGGGMAAQQVPDSAVRLARSIFTPRAAKSTRVSYLPVELVFDSFLVPSPAGLRATWQIGWQALYRAGDCSVDLRIEPDLGSLRMAVIGQVANHNVPNEEMADLPVSLKSGKVVVAETRSNRFGEFQMEYEQRGRLQLCIELEGGSKRIQVPLQKFVVEKPAPSGRPGQRASGNRQGD